MSRAIRAALAAAALLSCALTVPTRGAQAAFFPGVVFDYGGKYDKSFNEGVLTGIERFHSETGINYKALEISNDVQREQYLRRLAEHGADIILAVGFSQAPAVAKVAKEFPEIKFTLIDGVVKLPNVQSILFSEQEGSYLVGMLAALTSKTHTVGFVGGMDIPLIRRFECGYEQGVKAVAPDDHIIANMVGTTPAAWSDPTRGGELAKSQFDRGVDVVFAAAGQSGIGVLQAAKDAGKYSIGVDSNQNHLFPGSVLTSMVKRVDVAAYNAIKAAQDGTWQAGVRTLGLKEEGVGWALDENNAKLVTPDMKAALDAASAEIQNGTRKVANYDETNGCKY
ncbi:BMP family lipoprotein [Nitrospirillum viridazoti]|uniref:BMP family lipoprotein n=1 Tax=Nitrospirillum viridazoti TaxID=3144925 RepID=UPI000A970E1C|nr:BMP family ABC transporter substrate-binding protein [Nitrospirillum amazonense]TWB32794.1 nucleoside-binding protein [Nitrospirillum amazonense]